MLPWKAARPGDPLVAIDTPALVLDLDAFERNLMRMAEALRGSKVRLRAHAKCHKTPEIARRQVALGAVGICCQKVSEAAVFVEAGIEDVLVTNQVVGDAKLRHLAALGRRARIGVLVDHPLQVQALAAAAQAHAVTLDVYVEVNVGANRCGVAPGEEAVRLARQVAASTPLRFMGLHCYHGPAQHMRSPQERAAAIAGAAQAARTTREAIEASGLPVERVTGAGTGTFLHERDSGVFNEIQAGSYVFMDRDYGDNQRGENDVAFEHALFVRTTVMSRATPERAVVDAGLKASSVDSGLPIVWQRPDLRYVKASDEHGVLATPDAAALTLGDPLMLVPGHCDPTVNLYDELVCVRGERVEALWPIAARGALL
ncbi:alanine racemase [Variovorax sp. WS11]|uniref:DSD1 family PLP-dependent enzyme n=1 Tax=Variovorax sp. WS11 TaxID=1105204 RepID=UPI000D0DF2BA|nr:DSD1 family PLP-dependent enzyme [Variovorax sp. WS11]NDZ13520.1 DSD1 family PLP-dependent enzyme [Variovorax sp. WS11]PSL84376.1 alanine racemase [Variovorax sp. WS11]